MRTFRDSHNVNWTVFEVRRQITSTSDGTPLSGGISDGWLCFECSSAKRRLVRYPERWRDFSDPELEKLLSSAHPAPRPIFPLVDDLSDGSAASER